MRTRSLAAVLALWFFLGGAGQAAPHDASIWSGLVLATNEAHPKESSAELHKYKEKLANIFGYNHFELINSHAELMDDPYECWLVPSKDFSLRVGTHNNQEHIYQMKLELFQNARRLADFEARLGAESPLFIRGPMYARGQLIIVLLVKEPVK